ncbi:hypothetical protein HanLR1_Chr12g0429321 [Helianthus annuus]|nr:hypothetical protein HanLR1_Chr12g0429321 [Helianthus annuus]
MNVVPHTTCIRLGLRTSFSQFDDDTIPYHYFNFVNYDRLRPRIDNHLLLTDYIGRMERVSPILNRAGNNLLKINLQDQRYTYNFGHTEIVSPIDVCKIQHINYIK